MGKQKFTVIVTLEFIDGVLSSGSTDAPQSVPEVPEAKDRSQEPLTPASPSLPPAAPLAAAVGQVVSAITASAKTSVVPDQAVLQNPSNQGVSTKTISAETSATEAPRERKKRAKKTIVLDSPGQHPVTIDVEAPEIVDAVTTPVTKEVLSVPAEDEADVPVTGVIAQPVEAPEPPKTTIVGLPTPEQKKIFNDRYAKFTTNPGGILHEAGMVPSEGVGGIYRKLRAFAMLKFPHITDLKDMTAAEWERFLTYMENVVATENGPATLVAVINREIGVAA